MSNKPNIVFYFSDQQRADTLGCYGQKLNVTPNLDSFAQEATLFENAFSCQPVCGPMRACLQSGVYATQVGCFRNNIALPESTETIASILNSQGYETAYIGKWHLASDDTHDLKRKATPVEKRGGYQYWRSADVLEFTSHGYDGFIFDNDCNRLDFKGYRADAINGYACEFLEKRDKSKPFFMFVSQLEPHHQNDRLRFEAPKGSRKNFTGYDVPGDLAGTMGDWRIQMPSYLACCNRVDYNFGKLIEKLRETGEYENTVIIYTSDHGCHFRTRNSEYKRSCHESSIHVPLLIGGGSFPKGKRVNELVSLIDLPATVLDIAGCEVPSYYAGESLRSLRGHDSVYVQISESQTGRAVRTAKWKYSVTSPDRDKPFSDTYKEDFLYDLEKDPYEQNNLIGESGYESIKENLAQLLLDYMKKAGEPDAKII